jgi:hypothetical protein
MKEAGLRKEEGSEERGRIRKEEGLGKRKDQEKEKEG